MKPKISICIPAYNSQNTIAESIESALDQKYPMKEILVCDDDSSDNTVEIAESFGIRVIKNPYNMGIGKNLERLMHEAKGKYICYLCADDLFANTYVLNDIVSIFDTVPDIGIVGRYYYFFMDGHKGAIGVCRDKNILTSSCCPSGMAFRKRDDIKGTNRIFIEMPSMVAQYLYKYRWTMLEYDTVAARFHPGGNTGTKETYYTESPTQNWIDLLGKFQDFPMFIQLKNRAPKLLWREICLHVINDRTVLLSPSFWFYGLISLLVPRPILKKLSNFYRHRIARKHAVIIERPNE